jgi:hypothetical protein
MRLMLGTCVSRYGPNSLLAQIDVNSTGLFEDLTIDVERSANYRSQFLGLSSHKKSEGSGGSHTNAFKRLCRMQLRALR